MAAMLKSVAQGLMVHLSSITSSSNSPSHQDSKDTTRWQRRRRRRQWWRRRQRRSQQDPMCQNARETDHAHHVETLAVKECSQLLPFFGEVLPLLPAGDDNVRRSPFRTWADVVPLFLRGGGAKKAPPLERPHLATKQQSRPVFNSVPWTALVFLLDTARLFLMKGSK